MLSHFSRVRLSATLWTVACQAPQSMGFSRQDYWSALILGIFLTQGLNPVSLASPVLAGGFFTTSTAWESYIHLPNEYLCVCK